MYISKASRTLQEAINLKKHSIRGLARAANTGDHMLRAVIAGSTPKVTLALALERLVGIPLSDWEIPA